jgi:uncharacterized protein YjbI with pentapeptide repeats
MAIYTKEEIEQFRKRWEGKDALVKEIVNILASSEMKFARLDGQQGISVFEIEARINRANDTLTKAGFPEVTAASQLVFFGGSCISIPGIDLRGIYLQELTYTGIVLTRAHLEGAKFYRTKLENANLIEAHLEHSAFYQADLTGADLYFAHLDGADMKEALLDRANLSFADLDCSNLGRAHLEDADLAYAFVRNANLHDSRLEGADFHGADLSGAVVAFAHIGVSTKNNKTKFYNNNFLPPWRDHLGPKVDNMNIILRRNKGLGLVQLLTHLMKFNRRDKIAWRDLSKQIFQRWFYTNFAGVRIDDADTVMAPDLYRYVKDQQYLSRFKWTHPRIYWIWKISSDCGGRLSWVCFWAFLSILIFGCLYWTLPWDAPNFIESLIPNWMYVSEKPIDPVILYPGLEHFPFWMWLSTSFDIFISFGIRGSQPNNWVGLALSSFETILGFVTLGMLISVLQNRFARRS